MTMNNLNDLQKNLLALREDSYRNFSAQLLPTVDETLIIGVTIPQLRKFAKKYFADKDISQFLNNLPHKFHEENLLQAILISNMQDYAECLDAVKKFLPYINDWGVCDTFSPQIFKQHLTELEPEIFNWLNCDGEYFNRFGLSMLMKFYLDENFDVKYLKWAAEIRSDKYYAQMMAAWYFATALAKHYDETVIYLEERRLPKFIHRKTIRKAQDSYRISDEQKKYLRGLKF